MKTMTKIQQQALSLTDIVNLLHSTLEFSEILNNFASYLHQSFDFSGLSFEHKSIKNTLLVGNEASQQFIVNLSNDKLPLGKITFYRDKAFTRENISYLEEKICFLIQPLKNSLCHYQVLQASLKDPLTNLLNRSSLDSTLQREMKLAQRHSTQLAVMILDIDNFKMINDMYGHLAGDAILIRVAKLILETIRETDIAFRIGGEEFLVSISGSDAAGIERLAERLRKKVEATTVYFEGKQMQFTISLGVSYFGLNDTQNELISRADKAMYTAKNSGKNQVAFM
jgi:diguanylate cyclase (GGDEF)-like protein